VPWARRLVDSFGASVSSTYRTHSQQAELYRRYLAGLTDYPAAPPGQSYHEYGRAFDVVAPWYILRRMGQVWESWGGTWGGHFRDPIHFQA